MKHPPFSFRLEALPRSSRITIGLLGGSFNPPHAGHLHIARMAQQRLGLSQVVWLVSPQNPLKSWRDTAPLADRMDACRELFAGHGGQSASDIETQLGTRYTLDTLRALKRRWPNARFVWLMGSDNLAQFHRWRGWREIAKLLPMAVLERPPAPMKALKSKAAQALAARRLPSCQSHALPRTAPAQWVALAIRRHAASSSDLRKTLGTTKPL